MPAPIEPWLFVGGALLCCAVLGQALYGTFGLWRARAAERIRSDEDAQAFRREVHTAVVAARARMASGLAWEGTRRLRVAAIEEESVDVQSFYLTAERGEPLPPYLPGQYLTLHASVTSEEAPLVRCYSLSDRPRGEYYRLSVKRDGGPTPNEPERPFGKVSSWLHEKVRVGDCIECEAPRGAFFYDRSTDRPVVLIGSGIGVTPIVSMLMTLHHTGHTRPVHTFLGYRDGTAAPLRSEARRAANEGSMLSLVVAYSKPRSEDLAGNDFDQQGRISVDLLRQRLPSNNFDFYLCGPGPMMQELVPELLEWGVPDDAIFYEAFGPASVPLPRSEEEEALLGCEVRFALDLPPLTWDGTYASLLDLAEANGVPVASGCRVGNCGACRMRVVEGSTTTVKKPGMSVGKGECLACISQPSAPLLLEA